MHCFARQLFSRQQYVFRFPLLISPKSHYSSQTKHSAGRFSLLFAAGFVSLYEMYKKHRLHALSDSSKANNPIMFNNSTVSNAKLPYSKQYNFIADVVEHVAPAVVHIEVDLDTDGYFGHFSTSFGTSNGSGFIISENGILLTNAHVVRNKKRVRIKLADGQRFTGTVQSVDMVADLAVVKIDAENLKLPYLSLGDSDKIRAGEHCIAVGSPLSLSNTVTAGIISNVGRTSTELGLFGRNINYIQTDCMITSGNSGGPLVNLDGEVIGINSMKAMTGISFSLPINYAKLFLADVEKKKSLQSTSKSSGRRQTRYLGVKMFSLTPQIVEEMRQIMPMMFSINKGVYIAGVMANSEAQRAGIRPGDIIIEVNGREIESSAELIQYVQDNDTVKLKILRNNGLVFDIVVTPESIE